MTTYCILNPFLNDKNDNEHVGLTHCGINVMMDYSSIYKDPNVIVLLKGEIHNMQTMCSLMNIHLETKPECLIVEMYKKYGIDYMLQVLDGVFSFILFDFHFENDISKIYVVTDICGIVPIYSFVDKNMIVFAPHRAAESRCGDILKLSPGCYSLYELGDKVSTEWKISNIVNKPYFLLPNSIVNTDFEDISMLPNRFAKCIKQIVLKTTNVRESCADMITKQLLSHLEMDFMKMKTQTQTQTLKLNDDIVVFDEISQKQIHFSPKHFFISNEDKGEYSMFEHDIMTRKKICSAEFESDKKYPFFDKSFIMLYFSTPLNITYH